MDKLTQHNGVKKSVQIYGEQESVNRKAMETFLAERIEETTNENTYIENSYLVSKDGALFTSKDQVFMDSLPLFNYLDQKYKENESIEWFVTSLKKDAFKSLEQDVVAVVQPVLVLNSTEIAGYLLCEMNVLKIVKENDLSDVGYSVKTALYLRQMNTIVEENKNTDKGRAYRPSNR